MNRRGHLSKKIPQVKLRPAPAPSHGASTTAGSSRGNGRDKEREASPMNMMDEEIIRRAMADAEDEETSTAAIRRNSRPWKGVVITFTGVENKPYLTGLAKELGASVESALTVHVSHVVATGYGSAKYLYAIEHRLPVMTPSWIEEAHAQWLNGDELDNEDDQERHGLPPFSGLKIAISSIEPLDRRKQLIKHITAAGGQYSKDLDRSCTHLISAKPTSEPRSSEKVKWALREIADLEARKRRGVRTDEEEMKIVYEEWIWDCVAFGGRWKEDYYDARKARRGGRVKAEDVLNGTVMFDEPADKKPAAETAGGADAADNNEPAVMRKRKREGLDTLVGDLISTAGVKLGNDVLKSSTRVSPKVDDKTPNTKVDTNGRPSMLHSSRSTLFAASANSSKPVRSISERTTSLPPTAPPPPVSAAAEDEPKPDEPGTASEKFFGGRKFSHVILEQCDALENALTLHGGQFVSDDKRREGEKVDYIIVRLCSDVRPILTDQDEGTIVVTECWVEGCCFEERLLSPDKHIVFQPLPGNMPVQGASSLIVHLSGFSAENTVYMRRLLRAIGGTLSVKLNRQTTHLVSMTNTGQKVEKAREWGVKVMKESWLIAMARSGEIEPENGHRHSTAQPDSSTAISSRKTNDLTWNLSTMPELPDATEYARRPPSSANQPGVSQLKVTVSPTRMLKPSPTHIDEGSTTSLGTGTGTGTGGEAGGSRTMIVSEHALSPPKAETERLLNFASPFPPIAERLPGGPGLGEAVKAGEKEKITRHLSAPANPESLAGAVANTTGSSIGGEDGDRGRGDLSTTAVRAASMSAINTGPSAGTGDRQSISAGGSSLPKDKESFPSSDFGPGMKMTEALRQLVEKDTNPAAGKGRLIRRSRPSARIKSTNTRSPMHSVSPAGSRFSLSPIKPSGNPGIAGAGIQMDDAYSEHSPAPDEMIGVGGTGTGEESVQVKYVDAASARERRKIMAMFEADGDERGTKKARKSK